MTQTAFIGPLLRRLLCDHDISLSPDANLGARTEGTSSATGPYREAVRGLMWRVVMIRPDVGDDARVVAG